MEWQNLFLEIVKIFLPSMVVFMAVFFVIKSFLENEHKKGLLKRRFVSQEITLPLRLQAYERLTLFLERISPPSLLMRIKTPNMTVRSFQAELLSSIRSEFEHNISQQIYISFEAWDQIRHAKEETVRLINTAAEKLSIKSPVDELSKRIFEIMISKNENPVQKAMDVLKKEVQRIY